MTLSVGDQIALAAVIVTLLAALVALIGVWWQVRAKRKDDKLSAQLNRLDKQLSNLYGPLYSWYESGHENVIAFRKVFSDDFSYENEKYRVWMEQVFMRTNASMEEVIINNAELFIGKEIPAPFLKFSLHVAALKVYMAEWKRPNFDPVLWKQYLENFPHPGVELQSYIGASFEVLKERQTLLLSGDRSSVGEQELKRQIEERRNRIMASLLKDAKSPGSTPNLTLPPAKENIDISAAAPNKGMHPTAKQRGS